MRYRRTISRILIILLTFLIFQTSHSSCLLHYPPPTFVPFNCTMKIQYILALPLIRSTRAVTLALHNGNLTTLSDVIPQIAGLPLTPPPHPERGTMNMTNCCLLALRDAFAINDGYLVIADPSFLPSGTTPESVLSDIDIGKIPCTPNGLQVKAPFVWCSNNCAGFTATQKWLSPLVSFILPCLVFSTTIPRRRRLQVWDLLFEPTSHWAIRPMLILIRFVVVVVVVTLDVLIWLALCFAFSGPMILSGVFEAFLDGRISNFVVREGTQRLSKIMSTRLLYLILVGFLDFKWNAGESDTLVSYYYRC